TFDDIVLTNHALPSPAVAGTDQVLCNTSSFSMGATVPVIGTGTWSIVSGSATITSPAPATTTVTGAAAGTSVTLEWRVENGTCAASTAAVTRPTRAPPTPASAGVPSLGPCNNGTFPMAANTPTVGTGTWTVQSGTATITSPASPS